MVKRTVTLLFLLVYFSSSFITTQHRSERTAWHVLRAAEESFGVYLKNCKLSSLDLYPHYREAKKASFDFDFLPGVAVNISAEVGELEFALSPLYSEVCHSRRAASDRAPPMHT